MQVTEAVKALTDALGIFCGEKTNVGATISNAETSYKELPPVGKPEHPLPAIGGIFQTHFKGNAQPEAARTVDSILAAVLTNLGHPGATTRYAKTENRTERFIEYAVPRDASQFVIDILDVVIAIKTQPALKKQYEMATDAALNAINKIPGAKPFINFHFGKGMVEDGDNVRPDPHQFVLEVKGTPLELAREIYGGIAAILQDSDERQSRDLSKTYAGGKDLLVDLADPSAASILQKIRDYAARKQGQGHE
jgi:hypothetical protein